MLEGVVQDDRLSIEQKALARARRIVDQLIDEGDEALPESLEWVIPLAIPVRVLNDVDVESQEPGAGSRKQEAG